MADLIPLIVQNGINAGTPFVLNHLVKVTNVGPPAELSTIDPQGLTDSVSGVAYVVVPDASGTLVTVTNAQETFRVQGGAIIQGSGVGSVQIGQGALATIANGVAIGPSAVCSTIASVVVGPSATNGGNAGVVIGSTAALSNSSGVAVGAGAVVSGNAGGASGIAIGTAASAAGSGAGGGTHIAIGTNATAKAEDVVIGGNASSNQQSTLGVGSVVIGTSATANIAGGSVFCVVIGWNAVSTQKLATVLGSGAVATAASGQTRAIVIGSGASATATDAIVIGGGSALTTASIALGASAVDLGAKFLQLGAPGTPIETVVIGAGGTIASPAAKLIRFTNASGTNNPAGDVSLQAALSTGNATPGRVLVYIGAQVAGSSATLQTASLALTFSHSTGGGHVATFTGALVTGAPSGGTAAQWKFGVRVAATVALDTTQYVELDVGGTLYKVGVVT